MKIFISSTSDDLNPYREKVISSLRRAGHTPVCMEDFQVQDIVPLEKCMNDVSSSEIYVGIFAWRYGFIPEGYEESITELELRRAQKMNIPCMIFLLDESIPWLPVCIDTGEMGNKIMNLREELKLNYIVKFFTNPDNLATEVLLGINSHFNKNKNPSEPNEIDAISGEPIVGIRFANPGEIFKDRVNEALMIKKYLLSQNVRFICITGRGGMGKTALLSKICGEIETGEIKLSESSQIIGADGILYISCKGADRPTLERIFADVGSVLGNNHGDELMAKWANPTISIPEKIRFLLGKLRHGVFLLVLDNVEDILNSENQFNDEALQTFLDICLSTPNNLKIFATCRREIFVDGKGTAVLRHISLDQGLPEKEGIQLLRDLDPQGNLGIRDASEEILREVVQQFYGIPRAFEIFVGLPAKKKRLTLQRILGNKNTFKTEKDKILELLVGEQYYSLSEDEKRVLEIISVFNTPIKEEAISFIYSEFFPDSSLDESLDNLINLNAVIFRNDNETFELHPVSGEFVYSKIPEGDEGYCRKQLHRLAGRYWLKVADEIYNERSMFKMTSREIYENQDWIFAFRNCIDNYWSAAAWEEMCERFGNLEKLYIIISRLGFQQEREHFCGLFFEAAKRAKNHSIELEWLYKYSWIKLTNNDLKGFKDLCTYGVELAKQVGNGIIQSMLIGCLSRAEKEFFNWDEAKKLRVKSLELTEKYRNNRLHIITPQYAELIEAEGLLNESYKIKIDALLKTSEMDVPNSRKGLIAKIAKSLLLIRKDYKINQYIIDVFAFIKDYTPIYSVTNSLSGFINALIEKEHIEKALNLLEVQMNYVYRSTSIRVIAAFDYQLAILNHFLGICEPAYSHYKKALSYNIFSFNPFILARFGILCLEMGRKEEAEEILTKGLALYAEIVEKSPKLYEIWSYYGLAQLAVGKRDEAYMSYQTALDICHAPGVVKMMIRDLNLLRRADPANEGVEEIENLLNSIQQSSSP